MFEVVIIILTFALFIVILHSPVRPKVFIDPGAIAYAQYHATRKTQPFCDIITRSHSMDIMCCDNAVTHEHAYLSKKMELLCPDCCRSRTESYIVLFTCY